MIFHQCSFCENSFRSDEERKKHEEVCVKNGKTKQERFAARKKHLLTKEYYQYINK
jgi:hypothetical protein